MGSIRRLKPFLLDSLINIGPIIIYFLSLAKQFANPMEPLIPVFLFHEWCLWMACHVQKKGNNRNDNNSSSSEVSFYNCTSFSQIIYLETLLKILESLILHSRCGHL